MTPRRRKGAVALASMSVLFSLILVSWGRVLGVGQAEAVEPVMVEEATPTQVVEAPAYASAYGSWRGMRR